MSERPVRWLDDGQAGAVERELLRGAGHCEPPSGAEDRIWAALAARLPPMPGGGGDGGAGTGAGAGTGTTLGTLGALKSGAIGALVGLAVATSAVVFEPPPSPTPATTAAPSAALPPSTGDVPARAEQPDPGPAPMATENTPRKVTVLSAPSAGVAPGSSVGALALEGGAAETALREESAALQAVRSALRRGDAAGALATLDAARARFPASVLGQEREALTIQALAQAGQREAARGRARAFLAKFPNSPHAASLERFAEAGTN